MSFLKLIFPLSSQYLQEKESPTCEAGGPTVSEVLEQLEREDSERVVVVGPDRVDKTSLVFQATVSAAAAGIRTTHISTHPIKRLPSLVHGMATPESSIMRNVDFLYLEEASELIGWFAGVHTRSNLPSLIIVEDILTYATQLGEKSLEKSLARLCATIADGAAWIRSHSDLKRCHVLITAPTRMTSLASVLSQFKFRCASYQGPSKDDPNSQLTYESGGRSLSVKFCHVRDVIQVIDVQTSVMNKS